MPKTVYLILSRNTIEKTAWLCDSLKGQNIRGDGAAHVQNEVGRMDILIFLSEFMVPLIVFYIVGFGLLSGRPVFDDFLKGAKEGMRTVVGILPTLIGLMTSVGILRASGILDALAELLKVPAGWIHIPVPLVPVILVRMVSSSAATGLILDIFKEYGPDSLIGNITSVMMGCTETIFYTMSVYFMSAGIRKTRWTLPGALLATAGGIAASIFLAEMM
jgi:spore maturation protein B